MESVSGVAQRDAGRGELKDECESERQADAGGGAQLGNSRQQRFW